MNRNRLFFTTGYPRNFILFCFLVVPYIGLSQDSLRSDSISAGGSAIQDSAGINKTIKSVLTEAKEAAGQGESTWLPVLMILLVLCVVGFALWLSFRGPSGSEKRKKIMERQRRKS
jgi:hypothetical protein